MHSNNEIRPMIPNDEIEKIEGLSKIVELAETGNEKVLQETLADPEVSKRALDNLPKSIFIRHQKPNIRNLALYFAVKKQKCKAIERLIAINAQVQSSIDFLGRYPFHLAAGMGLDKSMEVLVRHDPYGYRDDPDMMMLTPLALAIFERQEAVAKILIESNVYLKHKNPLLGPFLHQAANAGLHNIVALLISKNCDVNERSAKGETPLMRSVQVKGPSLGNYLSALLLINAKANVESIDQNGNTGFHHAIANMQTNMLPLLFKQKIVNLKNQAGNTPLTTIIKTPASPADNKMFLVKTLIDSKADVNMPDDSKKIPLHLAVDMQSTEMLAQLLESKADIDALDQQYKTPLHQAIKASWFSGAQYLIQAKANPSNTFGKGKSFDIVRDSKNPLAVFLFLYENRAEDIYCLEPISGGLNHINKFVMPCFNPLNLQVFANAIEFSYLQEKNDPLLSDRSRIKKHIEAQFTSIEEAFFKEYSSEIEIAAQQPYTIEKHVKSIIKDAIISYLENCFLYERDKWVFCKPYIDTMLFEHGSAHCGADKNVQHNIPVLDLLLNPPLSKIISQYSCDKVSMYAEKSPLCRWLDTIQHNCGSSLNSFYYSWICEQLLKNSEEHKKDKMCLLMVLPQDKIGSIAEIMDLLQKNVSELKASIEKQAPVTSETGVNTTGVNTNSGLYIAQLNTTPSISPSSPLLYTFTDLMHKREKLKPIPDNNKKNRPSQ